MKTVPLIPTLRTLTIAILAALPLTAVAQGDDDVAALTTPANWVQFGLAYTPDASYKFGEYNGLGDSGIHLLAGFAVAGGDAYGQGGGTFRWSVAGANLGTSNRSLDVKVADQGKWKIGFSFDQLRHEITDSYQTPLIGTMGGNSFTMPSGFGVVSTARPSTALPYGTQTLTAGQQALFHRVDVHSNRDNSSFTLGYNFNRQWNAQLSWNHIEQSGAKLIGSGTDKNNSSSGFDLAGYSLGGEAIQILMNPTNYSTDNFGLAVNWADAGGFFTIGYSGSRFRDGYQSVSFPNPYTGTAVANGTLLNGPYPTDALSTAPNNSLDRFKISGGYDFTPTVRLVGGYSYGRNTQNAVYVNQDQMAPGGLPVNSLDGEVNLTQADLKLTGQPTSGLTLAAGINYYKRDNRTHAYTYVFRDLGGEDQTSVSIPLSYSKTQGTLSADYRLSTRQHFHAGYGHEKTSRWCNDDLSNNAQGELSATNTGYYTTASCVQVPKSTEDKYELGYRLDTGGSVNFNAGYSYSDRSATVNASFYNPMQANSEGFENYGYRAFFDASRTQRMIKAGIDWQPTDKLGFGLDGRSTRDQYKDSPLGVQHGNSSSWNLDATYAFSEQTSASAYFSSQRRARTLLSANGRNAVAPLANTWSNELTDKGRTYGVGASRGGLMGGKLHLAADLSHSLDTTDYDTELNYANASCTGPSNAGYSCGALPQIRSESTRATLTADYAVGPWSALAIGYVHERLKSNDYFYNFYQLGYTGTTTMPTNQVSPNYTEDFLFATYRYTFR